MALDRRSKDPIIITIHLEWNMNVWTKFHANPFNSCQDISLWTKHFNLMVALNEKSEDHQNLYYSSSVDQECLYKIHRDSWVWTKMVDQPTSTAIPVAILLWLKMWFKKFNSKVSQLCWMFYRTHCQHFIIGITFYKEIQQSLWKLLIQFSMDYLERHIAVGTF